MIASDNSQELLTIFDETKQLAMLDKSFLARQAKAIFLKAAHIIDFKPYEGMGLRETMEAVYEDASHNSTLRDQTSLLREIGYRQNSNSYFHSLMDWIDREDDSPPATSHWRPITEDGKLKNDPLVKLTADIQRLGLAARTLKSNTDHYRSLRDDFFKRLEITNTSPYDGKDIADSMRMIMKNMGIEPKDIAPFIRAGTDADGQPIFGVTPKNATGMISRLREVSIGPEAFNRIVDPFAALFKQAVADKKLLPGSGLPNPANKDASGIQEGLAR